MVGVASRFLKALVIVILSWFVTSNGQVAAPDFTEPYAAFDYLLKYGYVKESEVTTTFGAGTSEGRNFLRDKIKLFQDSAGLALTGELDTSTIEAMAKPRCGVPFAEEQVGAHRPKWNKKTLTYRIKESSTKSGLSPAQVKRTMRRALDYWQNEADLKFIESRQKSDIEITFTTNDHGDALPFDGREGVLAHAYYPLTSNDIGGDAHFDDDEPWSVTEDHGKQLLQTATHELGHSLGLQHSRVHGSVMYFSYPGWDPELKLHQDDINNIQQLYGPPQTPSRGNSHCVCDDFTRIDTKTQTTVGNCLTTFQKKKWCYVPSGTSCEDKQKSNKVDRYWSFEACNSLVPVISGGHCQCNGITRYDTRKEERVGHCQTQYRGEDWCYIASDSACQDKRGTRRDEDGKRYWSAKACTMQTQSQVQGEDYEFYVPQSQIQEEHYEVF